MDTKAKIGSRLNMIGGLSIAALMFLPISDRAMRRERRPFSFT